VAWALVVGEGRWDRTLSKGELVVSYVECFEEAAQQARREGVPIEDYEWAAYAAVGEADDAEAASRAASKLAILSFRIHQRIGWRRRALASRRRVGLALPRSRVSLRPVRVRVRAREGRSRRVCRAGAAGKRARRSEDDAESELGARSGSERESGR
jgi:hypothetical protein